MRQAYQQPFAIHLRQSAQHKLAEAAHVFDLSEDWFDDRFASIEKLPPWLTQQLLPHARAHAAVLRGRTPPRLVRGHVQINLTKGCRSDHGTTKVSAIARDGGGQLS